ncbi:MAG: RNA polymerase sigma factor, partial [Deltaproteobacteria bacterium]
KDASFELILAVRLIGILRHIRPQELIAQVQRILKPKGIFATWDYARDLEHDQEFSVGLLVSNAGLEVIKEEQAEDGDPQDPFVMMLAVKPASGVSSSPVQKSSQSELLAIEQEIITKKREDLERLKERASFLNSIFESFSQNHHGTVEMIRGIREIINEVNWDLPSITAPLSSIGYLTAEKEQIWAECRQLSKYIEEAENKLRQIRKEQGHSASSPVQKNYSSRGSGSELGKTLSDENKITDVRKKLFKFIRKYALAQHNILLPAYVREDLVQEALLRAWKTDFPYSGKAGASLETWLYKILKNVYIDWLREKRQSISRSRLLKAAAVEYCLPYEDELMRQESFKILKAELYRLSQKQKIVLRLRVEDLTLASIGKILSLSPNTVKTRFYTAIGILRQRLQDEYGIQSELDFYSGEIKINSAHSSSPVRIRNTVVDPGIMKRGPSFDEIDGVILVDGQEKPQHYYFMAQLIYRIADLSSMILTEAAFIAQSNGLEFITDENQLLHLKIALACLVENIANHEMQLGESPYVRIFVAKQPSLGVRIEFWGSGRHRLPELLTKKEWFCAHDRPWKTDRAPLEAIQGGTRHIGVARMFDELSKLKSPKPVKVGWRENKSNEGGRKGGHIIAMHVVLASSPIDDSYFDELKAAIGTAYFEAIKSAAGAHYFRALESLSMLLKQHPDAKAHLSGFVLLAASTLKSTGMAFNCIHSLFDRGLIRSQNDMDTTRQSIAKIVTAVRKGMPDGLSEDYHQSEIEILNCADILVRKGYVDSADEFLSLMTLFALIVENPQLALVKVRVDNREFRSIAPSIKRIKSLSQLHYGAAAGLFFTVTLRRLERDGFIAPKEADKLRQDIRRADEILNESIHAENQMEDIFIGLGFGNSKEEAYRNIWELIPCHDDKAKGPKTSSSPVGDPYYMDRREFSALLGLGFWFLPHAFATAQPYSQIVEQIKAYYENLFHKQPEMAREVREPVASHFFYSWLGEYMNAAVYLPPENLQGKDYFARLIKGIKALYGNAVLVVEGHFEYDAKPVRPEASKVAVYFREGSRAKVASVMYENRRRNVVIKEALNTVVVRKGGKKEKLTVNRRVSEIFKQDKAVLVEFGSLANFFGLTQERFTAMTEELNFILRRLYKKYPGRKIVVVPGHGGLNFETSHYAKTRYITVKQGKKRLTRRQDEPSLGTKIAWEQAFFGASSP